MLTGNLEVFNFSNLVLNNLAISAGINLRWGFSHCWWGSRLFACVSAARERTWSSAESRVRRDSPGSRDFVSRLTGFKQPTAIAVRAKVGIGYYGVTSSIPPSDLPNLSVVDEGVVTLSIKLWQGRVWNIYSFESLSEIVGMNNILLYGDKASLGV